LKEVAVRFEGTELTLEDLFAVGRHFKLSGLDSEGVVDELA
jgi:hypothetical protein